MLVTHPPTVRRMAVAGWVRGNFGIDERANLSRRRGKTWCLTHLPTGYAAKALRGSLKSVQAIADQIEACADWDFADPQQAKVRGAAVHEVMEGNPAAFIPFDEIGTAREVFQYPEESGQ